MMPVQANQDASDRRLTALLRLTAC